MTDTKFFSDLSQRYNLSVLRNILFWGFKYAIDKMTFRYFHPITFNAVRFTVSSAAMFLIMKMLGEALRIASHDIRSILWLSFIANAFYQFLFVLGLSRTGAGN